VEAAVEATASRGREGLDRFQELVREVQAEERLSLPALTVVVRELSALADTLSLE
jgi:hypothetical protein